VVSDNNSPPMWNGLSGGPGQKFAARAESWAGGLAILAHRGVGAIGSVFQSIDWLEIWNESIGRVSGLPFMIGVWEVRTGTLAALLPLLLRRSSCLRVIEWADCGVSDYNCPILGASAPRDLDGARAMWRTILDALPAMDIVKFTKMPGALGNRPNPLANLPQASLCAVHSNSLAVSSVWEDYLQSLERCFRKELRRSWRVFTKMARLSGSSIHKMTRVGCSRRWKANNEPDSERTRHTCWTAQRLPRSIAQ
jgi:CelD/BcsL family acetyltransferase involved in cellulose biosynthesis